MSAALIGRENEIPNAMSAEPEKYDVIIIGAGLSGLACAVLVTEAGQTCTVLEAHERPGGRVRSVLDEQTGAFVADLGPSWVWPLYQPVIARWLHKLNLTSFPQFDQGHAVLDYGPDQPAQFAPLPGQEGNERVAGGSEALVQALMKRLPEETIRCSMHATSVAASDEGASVVAEDQSFKASHVIVAVPPRRAIGSLEWRADLPPALRDALRATPTWMAPHAKVAVVYEEPFWRGQGLSGRIASRAGPIVEAHDHCGPDGTPAALWGFIGLSPGARKEMGAGLEAGIRAQLKRCFGQSSPDPLAVYVEDWATNALVASPDDLSGPMSHPVVGPEALRALHLEGRLSFAGAETALQSPGLIEGAFDAAERAVASVLK